MGHPSAGSQDIGMLREGGTYVEMGQFTDAGSINTSWHRICTRDLDLLGCGIHRQRPAARRRSFAR
jgi:hypothetical protein